MIRIVLALIFIQAFYCAEFPDLNNHIKLTWNNVSLEQRMDSSQTKWDEDGNVKSFILCAMYNHSAHGGCFYDYTFAQWTSAGANFSASGSGKLMTNIVSKVNETYSCLEIFNPVSGFEKDGGFREIYQATVAGSGSWEVNYLCSNFVLEKDSTWLLSERSLEKFLG